MTESKKTSPFRRFQQGHRALYDGLSLLLYQSIVYGWSFAIGPLGKDFAALNEAVSGDAPILLQFEYDVFGDWVAGYHIVNFGLLLLCSLLVYRIFRCFDKGAPIWLATLAATLFMANPVHAEAMLLLSGSGDLSSAFMALAALAMYGQWVARPTNVRQALAFLALMAVVLFAGNAGIGAALVALLHAVMGLTDTKARRWPFLAGLGCFVIAISASRSAEFMGALDDGVASSAGLYFILYPIGFLPESARQFHESWWLGWVAAAVVVLLLLLIYRKVQQRLFAFGLVGAVAYAAFAHTGRVDPVHLTGGGALLVPTALVSISAVVMFGRMMCHPKWRSIVVLGTTLLAFLFFGLTMQRVSAWRHASGVVSAFQEEAVEIYEETGPPVGVLPDYQFYRGAPIQLSESIRYDTPFSTAIPHVVFMKLDYDRPERLAIEAIWSLDQEINVSIVRKNVRDLVPRPYYPNGNLAGDVQMLTDMSCPDEITVRYFISHSSLYDFKNVLPVKISH